MFICTHRYVLGLFMGAIALAGSSLSAADTQRSTAPIALKSADTSLSPNRLSFPDHTDRAAAAFLMVEDHAAEFGPVPPQASVPLPSSAWTGLVGLATLALVGCRKSIIRFVT